jgi:RNase P subunit RPR2
MTQPTTCPKCNGSMEPGLTPKTFFGGMNLKGREPLPVTTYRCEGCGYLESFAIRAS